MRRVVVTGMGAITPMGLNVKEYFDNIKAGNHGFTTISKFDASEYKAHVAAEVKGFVAKEYMDFKAAKRMEPFSQYAVAAAKEAMEQAGLDMSKEDPYRVGCSIGSGIGSLQVVEKEYTKLVEKGPNRVNPLMVPMMISNMAAGNVSIAYGLKGKSLNVVTACATGTHSIGEAYRSIQTGDADVMLAGGTESCICPIGVAGFAALTALSGAVVGQYQKSADINGGTGIVVIGLACLIIGETLIGRRSMGRNVIAAIVGSIVYRFIYAVILKTGIVPIECLKLVTAIVVALAIAGPALKEGAAFQKRKMSASASRKGGN